MLYTWESVKSFYFMFHTARMSEAIADGLGWSQANTHPELFHLVRKPAVAKTHTAGPNRRGGPSSGQQYQPYPQTMAIHLTPFYPLQRWGKLQRRFLQVRACMYTLRRSAYRTSMVPSKP